MFETRVINIILSKKDKNKIYKRNAKVPSRPNFLTHPLLHHQQLLTFSWRLMTENNQITA